jgi:hypothetical protein
MATVAPSQHTYPTVCPHCGNVLSAEPEESEVQDLLLSSFAQQLESKAAFPELIISTSGRHICLPDASPVYLGRRDERRSIYPDIDLTQDGGATHGVSRQHACIYQGNNGTYVEDINSTNGTFVNGERLSPLQTYPLQHGDVLRLGQLELQIIFPHQETSDEHDELSTQPVINIPETQALTISY